MERFVLSVSPNSACAWLEGGLLEVISFFGGVGACSTTGGVFDVDVSAPRGPKGSRASSRLSRRVGCAPTLRLGLRPPAARGALPAEVVGDLVSDDPSLLSGQGSGPTRCSTYQKAHRHSRLPVILTERLLHCQ